MAAAKLATRREHTGSRQLDSIQRETSKTQARANACPFLVGVLRSVTLVSGVAKTVDHGLGRRATFLVVRENYDGTGTRSSIAEAATSAQSAIDINNQLSVIASSNCTVDLWFYVVASEAKLR